MSTATYKNLAGFSAERIALLEQDFAALDEAGAGLAERAVRYIVDGEDADVLAAVAKSKRPAERLRLNHDLRIFQAKARDGEARIKFFETVEPVGFEPYLRLARLFEAAAQGGPPVVLPFQAFYGGLPWLELFLQEIWLLQALSATPGGDERKLAMPLPLVEQMLEAEGQDPARLIRAVFSPLRQEPIQSMPAHVISRLPGFAESVVKHREIVAAALLEAGSPRKVELLHMLSTSGAPPQPFVAELVRLWLGPAKTVREWTSRLLTKVRDEARPHFEQAALAGTPAQRAAAIDWLGRNAREASREFLLARREAEKSAKLQDAINEALGEVKQEAPAPQSDAPAPRPPLPAVEKKAPLTPSSRQAVVALIEAYNRAATDVNQQRAKHRQQYPAHTAPDLPLYGESQLELLCRRLELADLTEFLSREPEFLANSREFFDRVLDFAAHPDVRLIQLIRLLGLVGWITERHWGRPAMLGMTQEYLKRFQKTHPPGFTAPELAAALDAVGVDDRVIGYDLLSGFFGRHAWLSEGIESYFAAHLDLLEDGLDNRPLTGSFAFEWRHVRTRTLEVVSKFEQLPPALVGRIWQLAIGAGKTDRSAAQQIMERFPDLPQRLADALASGDYPTRVVAAEWLGRSGGKHAAGLLHKALAKEKQDAAKDAMLTALERLGESIEPYLDRGKLLAEAERGLKKGLHKDLDWFPSHSWPDVRWADSGKPVPQEILNWLL
ncbi:MAG TPA: hypothetical protein VHC19_13625, partial [Pirellulales bacterium]|nr:hypothetical protein [Pirellulales bacterium]